MKLHRIKAGHYTAMINGMVYTILHGIHWYIYEGSNMDHIATAHTLTDARAMLEAIIEGGLLI